MISLSDSIPYSVRRRSEPPHRRGIHPTRAAAKLAIRLAFRLRAGRLVASIAPVRRIAAALGQGLFIAHQDDDSILFCDRPPIRWRHRTKLGLCWSEGIPRDAPIHLGRRGALTGRVRARPRRRRSACSYQRRRPRLGLLPPDRRGDLLRLSYRSPGRRVRGAALDRLGGLGLDLPADGPYRRAHAVPRSAVSLPSACSATAPTWASAWRRVGPGPSRIPGPSVLPRGGGGGAQGADRLAAVLPLLARSAAAGTRDCCWHC